MKCTGSHTLPPRHGMFCLTPDDLCTVTASLKHGVFMKTMEGSPQFHTAISHRLPSKKMNQTSLLAHNNKTPLSKRSLTLEIYEK